jgi:hypothetical protein
MRNDPGEIARTRSRTEEFASGYFTYRELQ